MNFKEMFLVEEKELINEAFKSLTLKKLVNMIGANPYGNRQWGKRTFAKNVENIFGKPIAWSELIDGKHIFSGDVNAGKDAMKKNSLVFWISKNNKWAEIKNNPRIELKPNSVIFATNGKNIVGGTSQKGDKIGVIDFWSKIPSRKDLISFADEVIIIDLDAHNKEYDVIKMREVRKEMKQGSWSFKTDKDFKRENKDRYEKLIADKFKDVDAMKMAADIKMKSDMIVTKFFLNPKFQKDGWEMIVNPNSKGWANDEIKSMSDLLNLLDKSYKSAGKINKYRTDDAIHIANRLKRFKDKHLEQFGNLDDFDEKKIKDNFDYYEKEINRHILDLRTYNKAMDKALKDVMSMNEGNENSKKIGFSDYFSKVNESEDAEQLDEGFKVEIKDEADFDKHFKVLNKKIDDAESKPLQTNRLLQEAKIVIDAMLKWSK